VIAATVLLAYAGLLILGAAPFLARSRWPDRAPGLAIAAWLALVWSAVASVVLGGLALLAGTIPVSAGLVRLLAECDMALRARYAHPGGAVIAGAGAVLAAVVSGRVTWSLARALVVAVLAHRRHRRGLALVGRPDARLGAVVVDHPERAAWCLPGPGRAVAGERTHRLSDDRIRRCADSQRQPAASASPAPGRPRPLNRSQPGRNRSP